MTAHAAAADIRAEIAALPRPDTPSVRAVRRRWSRALAPATAGDVIAIARALEADAPQEGKWVAYELVRHHLAAFDAVGAAEVADFASRIASWYATDSFGTVLSGPLWARGGIPDALIDDWSFSADRWLRRSALVATVGRNAVRADPARTLALCLRLAADRDDMVEKAVSWALRYLSQKDRAAVAAFMDEHGTAFAARVRREVRNKLATGRKNPRQA